MTRKRLEREIRRRSPSATYVRVQTFSGAGCEGFPRQIHDTLYEPDAIYDAVLLAGWWNDDGRSGDYVSYMSSEIASMWRSYCYGDPCSCVKCRAHPAKKHVTDYMGNRGAYHARGGMGSSDASPKEESIPQSGGGVCDVMKRRLRTDPIRCIKQRPETPVTQYGILLKMIDDVAEENDLA